MLPLPTRLSYLPELSRLIGAKRRPGVGSFSRLKKRIFIGVLGFSHKQLVLALTCGLITKY
jgi:hypothetical protein